MLATDLLVEWILCRWDVQIGVQKFRTTQKSKSYSDFGRSANVFLDKFWTGHKLKQTSRISRPYRFMEHYSVIDIAMYASLCPSVTVRGHLACKEQCMNIICDEKYLGNFWTPKHFGYFWTTFLVRIGLRIGHNLRNVRILLFYYRSPPGTPVQCSPRLLLRRIRQCIKRRAGISENTICQSRLIR